MATISPLLNGGVDNSSIQMLAEQLKDLGVMSRDSPFRVVEMALEIQVERMRVVEVLKARDVAVERLCDAYGLVRRYSELIEQLQEERLANGFDRLGYSDKEASESDLVPALDAKVHIASLEATINDLRDINKHLKEYDACEGKAICDPPPHYEENITRAGFSFYVFRTGALKAMIQKAHRSVQTDTGRDASNAAILEDALQALLAATKPDDTPHVEDIPQIIRMRNELLIAIPLPINVPDLTLSPILLPSQLTLHEFLNGAPAALRNALGNYRTLHSVTTAWCPDHEEHGFMYVPMYKCSTNPRTVTAHRWNAVDVIGRMAKPIECFYNNDGSWYYAGLYKAFWMGVVSTAEWETLSAETKTAVIKETLAARKNTTPQTNYETGQLYAAGALKLACVGLQCVGFNLDVYHSVSDLSTKLLHANTAVAAAAAAAAASSSSKPVPISPTVSTPASLPKAKFMSSPLFNAFTAKKPTLSQGISSTSGLNFAPNYLDSSNTNTSGTPPMTTSGLRESDFCPPTAEFGVYSQPHRFLPQCLPSSKLNSPLSTQGSGPCTPSSIASTNFSTPGISPIARPNGSGSGAGGGSINVGNLAGAAGLHAGLPGTHGLGSGSPVWNSTLGSNLSSYLSSLGRPNPSKGQENANAAAGEPIVFGGIGRLTQ